MSAFELGMSCCFIGRQWLSFSLFYFWSFVCCCLFTVLFWLFLIEEFHCCIFTCVGLIFYKRLLSSCFFFSLSVTLDSTHSRVLFIWIFFLASLDFVFLFVILFLPTGRGGFLGWDFFVAFHWGSLLFSDYLPFFSCFFWLSPLRYFFCLEYRLSTSCRLVFWFGC